MQVCALRSVLRHRDRLVRAAASSTQHMQKAMNQMNLQLHHVISDVTGKTGLTIIDAILAGERDPAVLAMHRDHRIKADQRTIARSLRGDWQAEHLFTLRQARATDEHYQRQITECDTAAELMLGTFDKANSPTDLPPPTSSHRKPQRNEHRFDARAALHGILGVDLTQIPGLSALSAHGLIGEIGTTLEKFPSVRHFASWLGLCPDNRISGGTILSSKTRDVPSRAAQSFRLAAQSLHAAKSALGDHFRRNARAHRGARSHHRHRAQTGANLLCGAQNPDAV